MIELATIFQLHVMDSNILVAVAPARGIYCFQLHVMDSSEDSGAGGEARGLPFNSM